MRVHTVAKLINNNWTNTTVSFALARNSGPEWSQYGVYGGDAGLGSRGRFYRLCPDGPLLQVSGGTQKPLPLPQVSRVFSSCSCPLLLCWRSLSLSLSLSLWRPCYIRTAKTKTKKKIITPFCIQSRSYFAAFFPQQFSSFPLLFCFPFSITC